MPTPAQPAPKENGGPALKWFRPSRLRIEWVDPFDGQLLCSTEMPYEPRKAAAGYYTTYLKKWSDGYKSLFSDILEGRSPKALITTLP